MQISDSTKHTRTLRFHTYGEPATVLALEDAVTPNPGPRRVRIRVDACGLNPADWALCRGLFPGSLPRGIGCDVSGIVDAVGEGVDDVSIGDNVFGTADYAGYPLAGASDFTIMNVWTPVPPGLDRIQAAALPMVVETAFRSIESLGVSAQQKIFVHGAGTMVGFAAVQIARMRGAQVIATAGETFADRLRAFGATVTPYGAGMVERVREIAGGSPDQILDASPPNGILPQLVEIASGDPRRVLTITDFAESAKLCVRSSIGEDTTLRHDVLGEFARYAAIGKFTIPVAQTFALEDWKRALDISESGRARGKLMLLPRSIGDSPVAL